MGDYFEWNATRYGLDVPDMDREHQHLISLMNSLHALRERRASKQELAAGLDALADYTAKHFADEEAYLARIRFPDITTHRMIHQQLLARVNGFREAFRRDGSLGDDFFVFLKMWLGAHISGVDRKYSVHAAAQARAAS